MQCRKCKNEIPDGSIFCNWCGEKQLRERKKKTEIRVPEPRQLPSGRWTVQLRREGTSVTEDTKDLCIAKARAIRAGFVEAEGKKTPITLTKAIDQYIERRKDILSPATARGYGIIQRNRFKSVMNQDIHSVEDWQKVINAEVPLCAPKTLKNAWGFIKSVLEESGVPASKLLLPQVVRHDLPWLDYEQILVFVNAVRDKPCELTALLALNSLRRSELCGLRWGDIDADCKEIYVQGAVVPGTDHKYIRKDTTKNVTSHRRVPVSIPRLEDLLKEGKPNHAPGELIVTCNPNTPIRQINRACQLAKLPKVGVHGLRRSFASLAYHLGFREEETRAFGGWADYKTVHDIYIKLAENDKKAAQEKMLNFYSSSPARPTQENR